MLSVSLHFTYSDYLPLWSSSSSCYNFIFRFWNGSESVIYLPILFNTIVKYIRFIDIYVNSVMSISLLWWIISPRGYHPFPIVMYQWSAEGWSFSRGTPVCSTNKTDLHDITEMLLKVALNTKTLTSPLLCRYKYVFNRGLLFHKGIIGCQ